MEAPAPGSPGIQASGSEERPGTMLRDAGVADHGIEEPPIAWRYPASGGYWRFLTEIAGAVPWR